MNVITQDGVIYVYTRATPPTNVTTCSLIKGKTTSGGYVPPSVPTYIPPQQSSGMGISDNGKTLKTKEIRYKEKCHNCGGKGTQSTIPILRHLDCHLLMCGALNVEDTIPVITDILMYSAGIVMVQVRLRR